MGVGGDRSRTRRLPMIMCVPCPPSIDRSNAIANRFINLGPLHLILMASLTIINTPSSTFTSHLLNTTINHSIHKLASKHPSTQLNWSSTMSLLWIVLPILFTQSCTAHYLPLDQCDFYFQGHRDNVPMLDVLDTRNITASPPILTKFDVEVVAADVRGDCSFLPDPSMAFEKRSCRGHFHVKNHHLSGRFANEEFASMEAFRFHQVLLALEGVTLADGTMLNLYDNNQQYWRPRRCVTFLTTPTIPHSNAGTEGRAAKGDAITKMMEMVPRMLNTAHRKKLNKIRASAQRLGHDMGALVQDVARFP